MKITEFNLEVEEDFRDFENKKYKNFGIEKISNYLWCITGEDIFDGDQHTLFIETDRPVEIIEKLYNRTINKGSHDIIFMPEINLMFDHGDYCISYDRIAPDKTSYLIRLYCRPLQAISIYDGIQLKTSDKNRKKNRL